MIFYFVVSIFKKLVNLNFVLGGVYEIFFFLSFFVYLMVCEYFFIKNIYFYKLFFLMIKLIWFIYKGVNLNLCNFFMYRYLYGICYF